ncbi:MAG: hypothetical protein H0W77_11445, partial [Acidobacteria bacterium]|nr:hypothetical protein [Acidobacteriota bacterium]
ADGKITTINETKLAKNLDSVQGQNLREPRFVTPTTAEFVQRSEMIKGLRETEQIRLDLGLISNRARRQNIGFAQINVEGQQSKVIAHSGEASKNGTIESPQRRFFKATKTREGNARQFEVEVKILENFASKYANRAQEIKGEIYLFSELPPCPSCTDIFQQFRQMFPNVRLEIASGEFRPAKIQGK